MLDTGQSLWNYSHADVELNGIGCESGLASAGCGSVPFLCRVRSFH